MEGSGAGNDAISRDNRRVEGSEEAGAVVSEKRLGPQKQDSTGLWGWEASVKQAVHRAAALVSALGAFPGG